MLSANTTTTTNEEVAELIFIEHLLLARHCAKHFIRVLFVLVTTLFSFDR